MKVYNIYGSVLFKKPLNLVGLKIDELLVIKQNSIEIKPPLMDESLAKGENKINLTYKNFGGYKQKYKGDLRLRRRFLKAMREEVERLNMVFVRFDEDTGDLSTRI